MSKTKKLSKVLALILMLALVIGILPMGAMASTTPVYVRFFNGSTQIGSTVTVTASDDNVYSAIAAAISANTAISEDDCSVDEFGINKIVYNNGTEDVTLEPSATESNDKDSILYTVDDKLSELAIGQCPVSAGSVITVYYAADYETTLFAYILPDGAATSGNAIAADNDDTVSYRVAVSTSDFNNLYSTIVDDNSVTISSTSYLEEAPTVTGYTVIKAYKPVVATSSNTFADWQTETVAAYNALTTTQKSALASEYAAATAAGADMSDVNALAYAVAPYTRANSEDLRRLSFSDSDGYMNIVQTATERNGFYPDVTAYKLETATGPITITAETIATGATISYSSSDSHMTVSNGVISFTATGTYTLTVTVTNSGTKSYTIVIPYATAITSGTPDDACGYLPIGQYSRGNGWGALYTNGTNTSGTKKGTAGYVSTGVSLGLLGGYIQYDLGENKYITDDASHPYGVDFIVYGNPFSGNPEAGAVMVSEDGKVWYNLAGSLHYDSNTVQHTDISYMKLDAATTIGGQSFAKGIHYSTNYQPTDSTDASTVNAAIAAATWTSFVTGTAWWPEYTSESYGNVWSDGHLGDHTDSYTTGDVYWNRSGTAEVITYRGVTRVKDDAELGLSGADATNHYRFGYADVRQAGSNYGTAVNPYDTLPAAAAGGDGFDLAWAVDDAGKPVNMSGKHIRFIRVYSAVLYNAGIFGETSAEVCGLYIASAANSSVGVTDAPTSVKFTKSGDTTGYSLPSIPSNKGTTPRMSFIRNYAGTATQLTITVNAVAGANVYVNNEKLTESSSGTYTGTISTPSSGEKIRVIIQDGTHEPYLFVII